MKIALFLSILISLTAPALAGQADVQAEQRAWVETVAASIKSGLQGQ